MICPAKEGCCWVDFWGPNIYEQWLQAASDPISPANNPPDIYKLPTLSELIKACGDGIMALERQVYHPEGKRMDIWIARNMTALQVNKEMGETVIYEEGDTPEEAVAKLWLEFNHPKEGAKWCSKHKVLHQDFCGECMDEEREKASHSSEQ